MPLDAVLPDPKLLREEVAAEAASVKALVASEVASLKASVLADAEVLAAKRKNKINFLWEATQAFLAVSLALSSIFAALTGPRTVPEVLTNALFVVLGFYFGRTNHARPTPSDPSGQTI